MICPKCGTTLPYASHFCGNCGANLSVAPSTSTNSTAGNTPPPPFSPPPHEAPRSPGEFPRSGAAVQGLIARVKGILLNPASEWVTIEREPSTTMDIYKGYVAPLAAIGVVAAFIGSTVVGVTYPIIGHVRTGIGAGLALAIFTYLLQFVGVFVVAWIVDALAPTFEAQRDPLRALKVTAYSFTPGWVAGALNILPMLGGLAALIGLYALYLFYLGLPVLMRAPQEKSLGYTAVVVVCAVVAWLVIGLLTSCLFGGAV